MRNGEPIHVSISSELKARILSGGLNPGDILPSENELAKQYSASRVTVRKSLKTLENNGLIYSCQGKGYFVDKPKHDVFSLRFSDDERGFEIVYRKINVDFPSIEVSDALEISPDQLVLEIRRIMKKRGRPVALDVKFIPYSKGMPILEAELDYAVFPDIVPADGPFAVQTKMEIGSELPNEMVTAELQCPADTPLLVVYRWLIDQNECLVGYGVKYSLNEYGRLKASTLPE